MTSKVKYQVGNFAGETIVTHFNSESDILIKERAKRKIKRRMGDQCKEFKLLEIVK